MVQSYSLIRNVSVADAIKITFWMKILFASALYKFYTSPSGPKTSVVILFLGGILTMPENFASLVDMNLLTIDFTSWVINFTHG